MSRLRDTCFRLGLIITVTLVAGPACLCPPCEGAAQAPSGAAVAPGQASRAPAGSRLVIWDGDGNGMSGGESWADCDKKPDCKAKLEVVPGVGKDGSTGLKFHAEGPGWNGFGWNWFGWWPETAGSDLSPYQDFVFWIRVEAESTDQAPVLDGMSASLGCSKGKKSSANGQISKYAKGVLDGKWHRVAIPLADLLQGKEGAEFDPQTAWEFRFGTWSPSVRNFTVYFDDIAAESP
jgi:hypothetical protein